MWHWLKENGFTENETKIEEGKKLWQKKYHREYQKKRRAEKRLISFYLTPSEYQQVEQAAKAHKRRISTFIKEACLAYMDQRFLIPDETLITEIREEISLIGYDIKRIQSELSKMEEPNLKESLEMLTDRISYLESFVKKQFENPPLIASPQ
ncbi:MAG: hypothetical protein R3B93_14260 [Bacteroidia bacterium]